MLGLEYIAAGYMTLADVKVKCTTSTVPEITVRAEGLDLVIDNTKSVQELNAMTPDRRNSPYGPNIEANVHGKAQSGIMIESKYRFLTKTYNQKNTCLILNRLEVVFKLDPKIYIARGYKPGSCYYDAIMAHEMKHFRTDRDLVNKYTGIIVKAMNNTFKQIGFIQGPYHETQIPVVQQQTRGMIKSIIAQYADNLSAEHDILQSQIDTLEEYRSVDAKCSDWPNLDPR